MISVLCASNLNKKNIIVICDISNFYYKICQLDQNLVSDNINGTEGVYKSSK